MGRIWQKYLKERCLGKRGPLPEENEIGEPIARGEGAGAHLLYCGRAGAVTDGRERSPVCRICAGDESTCGPDSGRQCRDCLNCQWCLPSDDPDSRIAFIEDVLRTVPVKDDRVLPDELFKNIMKTRLWQRLHMRKRVPEYRR